NAEMLPIEPGNPPPSTPVPTLPIEAEMAVPRPVMLAILGLALIAGAFLVTRSGSNQSVTQASKPAPQTPVHTPPQPATKPALQLRHTPAKPLQSTRALSRKPVAKPVVHPRVGADGEIPPQ